VSEGPSALLPPPQPAAEDAFVAQWRGDAGALASTDALLEAIAEASGAGRFMLAARLAQLLPDDLPDDAVPQELLGRLRRAATLVLHGRRDARAEDADVAWAELRARRMRRMRARQRDALGGAAPRGRGRRR
jgi:hypothetical protein